MEWAPRGSGADGGGLAVVPASGLFHHRPGWKVAVDLHPAPTAAGASTAEVVSANQIETEGGVAEEEGGQGQDAVDGEAEAEGPATGVVPKEVTAGEMIEIVVQAKDVYGNHRGVGEWLGGGRWGGKGMGSPKVWAEVSIRVCTSFGKAHKGSSWHSSRHFPSC